MARAARDVILKDGSTMRLESPGAGDAAAISEFFSRLSRESLYLRFQGFPPRDGRMVGSYLQVDGRERTARRRTGSLR